MLRLNRAISDVAIAKSSLENIKKIWVVKQKGKQYNIWKIMKLRALRSDQLSEQHVDILSVLADVFRN